MKTGGSDGRGGGVAGDRHSLTFGYVTTQTPVQLKNFPVYLSNGCTDSHQTSFED